ncbi:ABC transporter permease, partial [candidate division WOR-3 bacterium]|nr:ABC transporter permease [candidate division WOR-3 bacterium]
VTKRLQDKLGFSYSVQDWLILNKSLFAALKLEKIAMTLILFMIILVAAFNIVSTLIMIVIQKTREIGILRSIGMTRFDVMKIFILQGSIMGFTGTVLGIAVGLAICFALGRYEFPIDTDVYVISSLPITVNPIDVLVISLCSLGISFVSSVYPAYRASRLMPVEALRYE